MSITKFAIEKNRITAVLLFLLIMNGISSYFSMPQQENPGFIIRAAQIITYMPGGSPERIENLITDPIEEVVQQIPELDFVNSQSRTGISIVTVNIKESYKEMRPIWDNLRRKVDGIRGDLPSAIGGPFVNDEFGDVYGIIYSITGEGYTFAELKEVADQVRDELLRIDDVAKVDIYGTQEERIFIEYDNNQLARLGVSPSQMQQILQAQNIIFPGGSIQTEKERIALEPSGNYESLDELRKTVIKFPNRSDLLYLEDIATIRRGYIDPPTSFMRSSGTPALGVGISMREGGNIIELGKDVKSTLELIEQSYPIGVEFDVIAFQPDEVEKNVNNFTRNLYQAILLVVIVMLATLGVRTGLVVASLIPMTIFFALIVMNLFSITINTISLAALIIALGMLVDNAIVMSESILVLMENGKKAIDAAVESANELRIPLLTSSLTTAAAFLPIFLAESATGEYTADLFKVVTISLMCSWVLSLTMIPMLAVTFIKIKKKKKDLGFNTPFYSKYRGILIWVLKHRLASIVIITIIFFGSMQLGKLVPNLFFPESDRAFIRGSLNFPIGTSIDITGEMVDDLEKFLNDSLKVNENRETGIINWATFIGTGAPRYVLASDTEPQKESLAYLMITTSDKFVVDKLIARIETYLWDRYPDLETVIRRLDYGPPVQAPVQVRVYGRDEDQLFAIVDGIKAQLAAIPGTKSISDDWGARVKKLHINIDQPRAQRAGVSSYDIAFSLQSTLAGLEITEYREDEDLIPVIFRASEADRKDISKLETLDIFVQSTGRTVPLKQVADVEVAWEPSSILRRDRLKAVTVSAYVDNNTNAFDVFDQIDLWLVDEKANWPIGYNFEYGGELESSGESQAAIVEKLPLAVGFIILLLVAQFNSIRKPLIILMTIPLAMVGVFIGLILLGGEMGFMTFLGVISLSGIVINNAIVLIDRIKIEHEEEGQSLQNAIIKAGQKRLRPILLTTATTVGGMLPLYLGGGPMWESMAIAIIFGLIFSTMLTLLVVPLLYSLFFKVKFKGYEYS